MISERLFQFIWQFQYFNRGELVTTEGDSLDIITQGVLNHDQGPDFLGGQIRIGNTVLIGNIELHLKSSDWLRHRHGEDPNYNNVVLHVVWESDQEIQDLKVPTLELRNRIPLQLVNKYEFLMQHPGFIPCESSAASIPSLIIRSCLDRMAAERLELKARKIGSMLESQKWHWEEIFWRQVARSFGLRVNCDAFEALAESLPISILTKHKQQLIQLEALLLGQAGLLQKKFSDKYPQMLKKEYQFLARKLHLKKISVPIHFLRMHPGNFPTIRLSQLAALIHGSRNLFSEIREMKTIIDARQLFEVYANDYWNEHYIPDQPSPFKRKKTGASFIDSLLLNAVIPMMFAYAEFNKQPVLKEKSIDWMLKIAPELNRITRGFTSLGFLNENARDSQALIHLKKHYCDQKKCLECMIGKSILKTNQVI